MKKHEALSVGQIINQAIARTGHRDEYLRQQAAFLWAEVVGPTINRYTIRRFVDRDIMHVYVSSGPVKSELTYIADTLVARINAIVGQSVITRIIIH